MRSRLLQFALLAGMALTGLTVVGVAIEAWVLVGASGAVFLSLILLITADADRQVRLVRRRVQKMARDGVRRAASELVEPAVVVAPEPQPVQVEPADVLGAVRVLQAQYTARLDRLQLAVEEAVDDLRQYRAEGPTDAAHAGELMGASESVQNLPSDEAADSTERP